MYITLFWAVMLLISKNENNRAKFFLGIFMIFAFLLYLSHAVFFQEIISVYPVFDSIYSLSSLSVYPLYYWYIKLLTVETSYRWYNLRLLIPAVVFFLATAILYSLMSESERLDYIYTYLIESKTKVTHSNIMQLQRIVYIGSRLVFTGQVVYFLIFGRKLVKNYHKEIENFYSNLESRSIIWVNMLLYSLVVTSVMSFTLNILGRGFFVESAVLLFFPSLIFSVLLFFIGYLGYLQNHTVVDLEREGQNSMDYPVKNNLNWLNSKLLELFVEEEIYKNHDLKITQISEMLNTNRTYISKHINTEFSCTFSDFVNKYRIEEAKRLLSDKSNRNYSLNYISEKSGFGSMGSFMRVFRDFEGITPGQYRDKIRVNGN